MSKNHNLSILRMIFAGSVDDGKSTLMGRLFYDAGALPADQIDQIAQYRTLNENNLPDFSLFTDGLREERTKGITIDVAYRYFRTKNRQYIVADTPGHFHFTRNMITAASNANLIVLLVDVQQGMIEQTKLHMEIANRLGIKHWIVCVNKMDRVDYQMNAFERVSQEIQQYASAVYNRINISIIPVSALHGDHVVEPSASMTWYSGPTLLELIEQAESNENEHDKPLRFSVQCFYSASEVATSTCNFALGRVEGGCVYPGDDVAVWPGNEQLRVSRIFVGSREVFCATEGMSVTLQFSNSCHLSRGMYLCDPKIELLKSRQLRVTVCWLSEQKCDFEASYLLKHGHNLYNVRIQKDSIRDTNSGGEPKTEGIQINESRIKPIKSNGDIFGTENEIFNVLVNLEREMAFDPYKMNRNTGSVVFINPATFETCAAGFVCPFDNE